MFEACLNQDSCAIIVAPVCGRSAAY